MGIWNYGLLYSCNKIRLETRNLAHLQSELSQLVYILGVD